MSEPRCELCGEPMPPGEDMFKFHGYSGNCPRPPLAPEMERLNTRVIELNAETMSLRAQLASAEAKRVGLEKALRLVEFNKRGYCNACVCGPCQNRHASDCPVARALSPDSK